MKTEQFGGVYNKHGPKGAITHPDMSHQVLYPTSCLRQDWMDPDWLHWQEQPNHLQGWPTEAITSGDELTWQALPPPPPPALKETLLCTMSSPPHFLFHAILPLCSQRTGGESMEAVVATWPGKGEQHWMYLLRHLSWPSVSMIFQTTQLHVLAYYCFTNIIYSS